VLLGGQGNLGCQLRLTCCEKRRHLLCRYRSEEVGRKRPQKNIRHRESPPVKGLVGCQPYGRGGEQLVAEKSRVHSLCRHPVELKGVPRATGTHKSTIERRRSEDKDGLS